MHTTCLVVVVKVKIQLASSEFLHVDCYVERRQQILLLVSKNVVQLISVISSNESLVRRPRVDEPVGCMMEQLRVGHTTCSVPRVVE